MAAPTGALGGRSSFLPVPMDGEVIQELPVKEDILIPRSRRTITVEQTQINQATQHLPNRVSLSPVPVKTNYQTKIHEAANRIQQFRRENEPFMLNSNLYPKEFEVGSHFVDRRSQLDSIINSS